MDNAVSLIKKTIEDLDKLADSNGIVKSVIITRIYGYIVDLKSEIESMSEQWRNDKLVLEAKIQDLTELLESRNKEEGA